MELEWNRLYCGDNMPILEEMVRQKLSFNLILTDPPYSIGKDFGNNTDSLELQEFLNGVEKRLALMDNLLSNNGSIVWFCTHRYVGHIQMLMYQFFKYRRLMIWHYKNGMSRQVKEPVTEYDPFLWFSKTDRFVYNLDDVRVPYKTTRVKNPVYKKDKDGNKRAWLPNPKGAKRGDVWEYPTLAGKRYEDERTGHPTQKPQEFMIDLIKSFCPKNADGKYEGRVLDPYIGSGTTAVCCEHINKMGDHKIRWMGIEMERQWIDEGNRRIEEERDRVVIDVDLFGA